jgi:uncharacterized protein YceH (UPF0502 family)
VESLDAVEIRVLGCLLEKQQTTPDAYPLTLNSLRLACNQSTNRDPVAAYDEATVREAAQRLGRRGWSRMASYHGSRSAKYRHLVDDKLGLAPGERALLCVLMLRGPQTLGELKQRTERMHSFPDLKAVEETLEDLTSRELGRWLDRRPGQKERRYAHLLQEGEGEAEPSQAPAAGGRKQVVERYIEGFRTGDHALILGCLTDDVEWQMPPHFELRGKAAFDGAIENEGTPGLPDIQLIRLVEEGDLVVAEGAVQAALKDGGRLDALFCDVFRFRGDEICRLVTYQVDRHPGDGTRRGFEAS